MTLIARLRVLTLVLPIIAMVAMPHTAHAVRKTSNVVIVGDSVTNVLRWAPESMKPLWSSQYNAILETWGCQQLINSGCSPTSQLSALQRIISHRRDNIEVYVVATGYNDTGNSYLSAAIKKIAQEVKSQGATLMWLTYREDGNVQIKNRMFNEVVRSNQSKLQMEILDWEKIARQNKHWFSGDSVHMNRFGGLQLARHIKMALDVHYGRGKSAITTTTSSQVPTTISDPTTTSTVAG
ncbi:MAG: SGNH/GDSL hydrolase family protein [Actinomycetota bacterium]